jgi:hypothetical protein
MCSDAPSSASRTITPVAMPRKSSVSAATDINIGIKALGLLLSERIESERQMRVEGVDAKNRA